MWTRFTEKMESMLMDSTFSSSAEEFVFILCVRLNSTRSKDLNASHCLGKQTWNMSREEGNKKGKERKPLLVDEQVSSRGN